jgi:hypothetical protein
VSSGAIPPAPIAARSPVATILREICVSPPHEAAAYAAKRVHAKEVGEGRHRAKRGEPLIRSRSAAAAASETAAKAAKSGFCAKRIICERGGSDCG